MDKQCVNYEEVACMDGSCPAAQDNFELVARRAKAIGATERAGIVT